MTSRREFLKSSSAALAAVACTPLLFAKASAPRIPIVFSTLGCPAWDWTKILDFASQHGFSAIELRGLQGNMDLPSNPLFSPDRIAQTKTDIAAAKLKIACVSSSANLYWDDPEKRAKDLSDARRFIELASTLGAPYVRVFGGKEADDKAPAPNDATKKRVAAALRELGDYAGPRKVTLILESHDHFTSSATLKDVMHLADSPHVGLLWDAHHTFVSGKEEPEFTVGQLGNYIHHTHLKDSRPEGNDVHYVLTGQGTVPVKRQVEALVKIGYRGYYSFEWEKVWHPDIDEPEIAIADYAKVMAGYLKGKA